MIKREHPIWRTAIGESSHRFLSPESTKPCVIAGVIFDDTPGFQHDSDGDVVFHAMCNAISSLTHAPIISEFAQALIEREGIVDSEVYLRRALTTLVGQKIMSVSVSLEAKRPTFQEQLVNMRQNIARILEISIEEVGITAIFGDGLTDSSCGDGVHCLVSITTVEH
jgi:2-C-methyl-D-erythritol 2,4-cyclodiphosphate synthase